MLLAEPDTSLPAQPPAISERYGFFTADLMIRLLCMRLGAGPSGATLETAKSEYRSPQL